MSLKDLVEQEKLTKKSQREQAKKYEADRAKAREKNLTTMAKRDIKELKRLFVDDKIKLHDRSTTTVRVGKKTLCEWVEFEIDDFVLTLSRKGSVSRVYLPGTEWKRSGDVDWPWHDTRVRDMYLIITMKDEDLSKVTEVIDLPDFAKKLAILIERRTTNNIRH